MPESCDTKQDCCPPDPHAYRSADAEDSLAGTNSGCIPATVIISPESGSQLFFPSYIVLTSDNEDAAIRYTTDGTDPDELSTLYTAPFQITQAGTMVKARAYVEGCSAGPVAAALYQNPPFPIGLAFGCAELDKGGTWNEWAPNGTDDNHWQLQFIPASNTTIKRLEMRQLNALGIDDTGILWSTDSDPNPSLDDLHNPTVWLKADAIPGLADGAAIASWPDSSGNGNDAVQATGANQPLYKTSIVNSKPVVRFDGTNDELLAPMPVGATKTFFFVVKKRGAIGAVSQAAYGVGGFEQLLTNTAFSAAGWVYWETGADIGGDPTNWGVVTFKHESVSSVKIYLNATLAITADPNNGVATAAAFGLGSNGVAAGFGDYDIAEVLMYDSALSDSERLDVYDYLNEKYFEAAPTYDTLPLVVFEAGAQQWAAYQNTLGIYPAGTYTWDLYGDEWFPAGGFFQLDVIFEDNTRATAIIGSVCDPTLPPVPCPSPAAPTVTGKCEGKVDVTFANGAPQNYKLFVAELGHSETFVVAGTTSTNPETVEISDLTKGALHYFRVELEYAGCGFQSSIPVSTVPLPDPVVSIATNKTLVDPSESFTISWASQHIGGAVCGGCLDGQVSINQSLGCKAGNAASSQATSKAAPGVYTYEITGCNVCGTVTASVQVEVRDVAVCAVRPSVLNMANPLTFLCGLVDACFSLQNGQVTTPWNGQFFEQSACNWRVSGGGGSWGGCDLMGGGNFRGMDGTISLTGGVWRLILTHGSLAGNTWEGSKAFGNSPLGVYTRTGGCATGPSSLTIT